MEESFPPKPPQSKQKDSLDKFFLELELSPEADTIHVDDQEISSWPNKDLKNIREDLVRSQDRLAPSMNNNLVKSKEEQKESKTTIDQLAVIIAEIKRKRMAGADSEPAIPLPAVENLPNRNAMDSISSGNIAQQNKGEQEFSKSAQSIYLSCGHNEAIRAEIIALGKKLGLNIILKKEDVSVMKRFEDVNDIRFAVVILSGDDFVYSKDQTVPEIKFRPAQQVVLELGFLLGKLGRQGVFVLYQELKNFEFPTNFFDILYTPYTKMGSWQFELLRQLKNVGYHFDANKLL